MEPPNDVFWENGGRNLRFCFFRPPKGTSLCGTVSFDVFCVKICARVSAVAFLKNPQKTSRVTLRRTETPKPIWIQFCTMVDIPDVVTYTNFGDHRLWEFWVAGGSNFPLSHWLSSSALQHSRTTLRACDKHVYSTMTRSSRFHCPIGVINKPTTVELWLSHVYRRLAVAKFSKSTM